MLHLHVPKMHCGSCAGRVTRAIRSVDPDAVVQADLAARNVDVSTLAAEAVIRSALEKAGYPVADSARTVDE